MLSYFPPDVLHTLIKGIVEMSLGFVLQILVAMGRIDEKFAGAVNLIAKLISLFPGDSSFHPVRHIHFEDIWELFASESSKYKSSNMLNTTGHILMKESYKLLSALLQLMLCLLSDHLLPVEVQWSVDFGFEEPYFSVKQIVLNTLNAVFEVVWYSYAPSLSATQIVTFKMLIANVQSHMLLLNMLRKRILLRASFAKKRHRMSTKKNGKNGNKKAAAAFHDPCVGKVCLYFNPKFELLSHFADSRVLSGCENYVRDTNYGELMMKLIRTLFGTTSKRFNTTEKGCS